MTDDERDALLERHAFRWTDDGWVGRSGPGGDFHDLYIERTDAFDEHPPVAALAAIIATLPQTDALKHTAVETIIAARQAALNWRAGPPLEQWSIVEARVDRDSAFWLTLHEYETDEYSCWPVKFGVSGEPALVLRRAFTANGGGPWTGASEIWKR